MVQAVALQEEDNNMWEALIPLAISIGSKMLSGGSKPPSRLPVSLDTPDMKPNNNVELGNGRMAMMPEVASGGYPGGDNLQKAEEEAKPEMPSGPQPPLGSSPSQDFGGYQMAGGGGMSQMPPGADQDNILKYISEMLAGGRNGQA